jgi:hypothetical protein
MKGYENEWWLASATLSLTVGLFAPMSVYIHNADQYPFLVWPVIASTLGLSALLMLAMVLVSFMCWKMGFNRCWRSIPYVFSWLALVLWLQGNLLALDLGPLTGRPVIWNEWYGLIGVNLIVWLSWWGFGLRWWRKRQLIIPVCVILLLMQATNMVWGFFYLPDPSPDQLYDVDETQAYRFSKLKNVVIIVMDTFQADVFEEILVKKPELRSELSGFTYYQNTAGGYQSTTPSLPLIMSGNYYDNKEPISQFVKRVYLEDSLPKVLKKDGYHVSINCNHFMFCDETTSDVLVRKPLQLWLGTHQWRQLIKPTTIRYSPSFSFPLYHWGKQRISEVAEVDFPPVDLTPDYYREDMKIVNGFLTRAFVEGEEPVFRYYHFTAPHPPFYLNEAGEYERQTHNQEGFVVHSSGALQLALKTIDTIKGLGIYDQTMIVLMSDHGYGMGYKRLGDHEEVIENNLISSALALLLVKPFGAITDFEVNRDPVSFASFKDDVVTYLWQEEPGTEFDFTLSRERRYFYYDWQDEWKTDYLPTLTEYVIGDEVRNPDDWMEIMK